MSNPHREVGGEPTHGSSPARNAPVASSHPTFADDLKKLSDTDLYALLNKLKNDVTPEEAKDPEMGYLLKRADRLIANFEGGEQK